MSTTVTNTTSLDSGYSSGVLSVPNPTPAIEAADNDVVDRHPPTDFSKVTRILGPLQEMLNELALEAGYPSPPINTPEPLSPAPSVCARYPTSRGRGMSGIGDRLAQLKIGDRKFHHRDIDVTSSNRSLEPSIAEDEECDGASIDEVLSDGGKDKHAWEHGGSPTVNPRLEEYLSFHSKDLPRKPPSFHLPATVTEDAAPSSKTALDNESLKSRHSVKTDGGVHEVNNWGEELEETVDHVCMRLEQLASDEFAMDPTKSFEEYYIARLNRLLGYSKRAVPVTVQKKLGGEHELK